jgi:hypothetical protein
MTTKNKHHYVRLSWAVIINLAIVHEDMRDVHQDLEESRSIEFIPSFCHKSAC